MWTAVSVEVHMDNSHYLCWIFKHWDLTCPSLLLQWQILLMLMCSGITCGAVCVYSNRVSDCVEFLKAAGASHVPVASGNICYWCSINTKFHEWLRIFCYKFSYAVQWSVSLSCVLICMCHKDSRVHWFVVLSVAVWPFWLWFIPGLLQFCRGSCYGLGCVFLSESKLIKELHYTCEISSMCCCCLLCYALIYNCCQKYIFFFSFNILQKLWYTP